MGDFWGRQQILVGKSTTNGCWKIWFLTISCLSNMSSSCGLHLWNGSITGRKWFQHRESDYKLAIISIQRAVILVISILALWCPAWRRYAEHMQSCPSLYKIPKIKNFVMFFLFYFIFKLYIIVLVLPNIKMNPPQVYMCSPFWTLLPPLSFNYYIIKWERISDKRVTIIHSFTYSFIQYCLAYYGPYTVLGTGYTRQE